MNSEFQTYQIDSSYYFTNINDDSLLDDFNKKLSQYAKSTQKLIYFLNKPLVEEDSSEDYSKVGMGLILKPDHKLIFVNFGAVDTLRIFAMHLLTILDFLRKSTDI